MNKFILFLYLYDLALCQQKILNLGFIFPNSKGPLYNSVGYELSAGSIPMAIEKIWTDQLLPGYNFTFKAMTNGCTEMNAIGYTHDLIYNQKIDVIFGPPCDLSAMRSSLLAKFEQVPNFLWGLVSSDDFQDAQRFSNVVSVTSIFPSLALAVHNIMESFNWVKYTFIYSPNEYERCTLMYEAIVEQMGLQSYKTVLATALKTSNPPTDAEFDKFISFTKPNARIILGCFDDDSWKRRFLIRMAVNGLAASDEYVFLSLEVKNAQWTSNNFDSKGNRIPFYLDPNTPSDGKDALATAMAMKTLVLDSSRTFIKQGDYDAEVLRRISEWPFYCSTCNVTGQKTSSTYSRYLYDAILVWATILNKTLPSYGDKMFSDASLYRKNAQGSYEGATGTIRLDVGGIRSPYYQLTSLGKDLTNPVIFNYTFTTHMTFVRADQINNNATIFKNWNGHIPLNQPLCGYLHKSCPIDIFKDNLVEVIIVAIVIAIVLLAATAISIYAFYTTQRTKKKMETLWMIHETRIEKAITSKSPITQSSISFNSGKTSNSSKTSFANKFETKKYVFLYLDGENAVGDKIGTSPTFLSKNESWRELNEIMSIDNDNINKFFGISGEGKVVLSIWKYCKRGNLSEILQSDNSMFDTFFLMSLVNDITSGLGYLHSNPVIRFHGRLSSKTCLISDRWQLKITNFDFKEHRAHNKINSTDKLFIAPEHLRNEDSYGSQEGDIYSLAIVFSEILTKQVAWNIGSRSESIEEVIYLIKRGGSNPIRPDLKIYHDIEVNPAMVALIKDCWKETERPTIKQVRSLIRAFTEKGPKNLMDHVFNILEEYAATLKLEVDQRSRELVEEQRRSDLLLSKMLPPQIASKLKMGTIVEPENFDCTIMFSDVVRFASYFSKCSPLQLINLVNELFIMLDNIIELLEVYKVEAIADGYLVVAGLPNRIPHHATECAKLALKFMEGVSKFRIPHLPTERVQLRIGLNSGPVVASVVGISMPRYCLFGDTVNTASRMESNSKEGKIHVSEACYNLLSRDKNVHFEPRGNIIIKGKGVMNTYWLSGMVGVNFLDFKSENPDIMQIKNEEDTEINKNEGLYKQFLKNQVMILPD
uniref:Guanylate cyclase n=1 Tax=Rhabditophanes sp. KR3021 TaxID=114890 RepID=A0AC35THR4_9BILA